MIIWEGFGRKQPWHYIDTSLEIMWKNYGKPLKGWLRIAGVLN
jgi:hypothetical protein